MIVMMMHVWLCQRQSRLIHLYPSPVVFTLKLQDPNYAVDLAQGADASATNLQIVLVIHLVQGSLTPIDNRESALGKTRYVESFLPLT